MDSVCDDCMVVRLLSLEVCNSFRSLGCLASELALRLPALHA